MEEVAVGRTRAGPVGLGFALVRQPGSKQAALHDQTVTGP